MKLKGKATAFNRGCNGDCPAFEGGCLLEVRELMATLAPTIRQKTLQVFWGFFSFPSHIIASYNIKKSLRLSLSP